MKLFFILPFFLFLNYISAQESTASKQVSTFTLEAPQLKANRKIWLYLPINYENSKKKYPVIYMHDAQNLFDAKTSFAGEWNVDEKLDSLKAQVIVVAIENGGEKRINELTPYKNEKYGGGETDKYIDFIINTLKPEIDKKYRTKPDKKNTTIMGSSLGGLTSYYAVLKYPEIFGKAGVFSPAFWINRKEINDLTTNSKKIKAKIYFMCGDSEGNDDSMVKDLNHIELLLNTNRCQCLHLNKKIIVKGGHHNEKLWRDGFDDAILWLGY